MARYKLLLGATGVALFGALIAFVGLGLWGAIPGAFNTKKLTPTYPLSIAVINLVRVKNEALSFQEFTKFREKRYSDFHKDILESETKLRKEHEELQKQENSGVVATPEIAQKKEDFEKRLAELDQSIQQRKEQINTEFAQITIEIKEKLKKIIDQLGHERNLNLILNATTDGTDSTLLDATVVLYGGNEIDLTDEVIHYLDKELPSLKTSNSSQEHDNHG